MTAPPTPAPATPKWFHSRPLLVAGCLVVLAGFVAPFLLPRQQAPAPPARPTVAPKPAPLSVPEQPAPAPIDERALLLRLAGGTTFVLVLLVGTLVVLRRWLVRLPPPVGSDLRILGGTRLDGRSLVYLVEARGQRLLVGADQSGVKQVVLVPSRKEEG